MGKHHLGIRIKELREKSKLSQAELAKVLTVPRSAISQIESGYRMLQAQELIKIAEHFNVSLDQLVDNAIDPKIIFGPEAKSKPGKPYFRDSRPQIKVDAGRVKKFKNVLLYILQRTAGLPNVGETVLNKLLYFIDFNYYEIYEEQLIGASYIKNKFGPTPVELKKVLDQMIEADWVKPIKTKYGDYQQTRFLPLKEADLDSIKASEIKVIDEVIGRLAHLNANQISEYSHNDVPWMTTKPGETINYESVFYRTATYSVRNYDPEQDH